MMHHQNDFQQEYLYEDEILNLNYLIQKKLPSNFPISVNRRSRKFSLNSKT
jgi:hypothetical protein